VVLTLAANKYRSFPASLLLVMLLFTLATQADSILLGRQRYYHFTTPTPLSEKAILILGFMGGRDAWDTDNSLRKLALKLRSANNPLVYVETVENGQRALAIKLIRTAFDRNQDGRLDQQECASAPLILYGQSFGGAAIVKLARQLKDMGMPVLLTVQVDSVGRGDKIIPSNVARAANLFQENGLIIRGESPIVAEDPARTTIIGNFQFDYSQKTIDISRVPWYKKLFRVAHSKMEHDPDVWTKVEELILDARTMIGKQ
jgi:hypothetical protein